MTQTSKTEIPTSEVTPGYLMSVDLDTIVVVSPSGARYGDSPSLTFGLGSWDGDYEGFAAWLATRA